MLHKILQATAGRPCSCPTGKICTACKKRKPVRVKPIVSVEGYKALPVPVKITTYKDKTRSTVLQPPPPPLPRKKNEQYSDQIPTALHYPKKRSCSRRASPTESASQETKICRWYRRRKALQELREITKKEQAKLLCLRLEKARREREAEFLEQLMRREKEIRLAEQQLAATPKVPIYPLNECPQLSCERPTNVRKRKKKTKKAKNIKATEAKLCCQTQVVCEYGKKYQKRPLNERFSIFCYKVCCQFYCCLTFLMLIGFAILYLL